MKTQNTKTILMAVVIHLAALGVAIPVSPLSGRTSQVVQPSSSLVEPPEPAPAEPYDASPCSRSRSGVPVYLFSGEVYHEAVDLRIKGRGLDFVWARKYRSRIGPNTAQGNGWDYSYNIRIVSSSNERNELEVHDGNTRRDVYRRQPDGRYARDEFFRELVPNADRSFTLVFPDTSAWHFHPLDGSRVEGRIKRITDRNGNNLGFAYDGNGRLTTVTDTLGRDVRVGYDRDGFVASITDFTGRQVRYNYYRDGDPNGASGDLRSVTMPAVTGTPNGNDFPAGKTTTYTYSTGLRDEQLNHNLLTVTDPKGQTTMKLVYSTERDAGQLGFDRVERLLWGGPDDVINVVYARVPASEATNRAQVKAIVNDRMGNVGEHFFDMRNRLVLHRVYTGRARRGNPTTESLNRPTGRLRETDPLFFDTRYNWNDDSLASRVVHANGMIVENTYESDLDRRASRRSRGNLRIRRHLPGLLGAEQRELVERFEYSPQFGGCCGFNFVTKATDARGNTTLQSYDARGNLVRRQDRAATVVNEFEYDEFGRIVRHVYPDNGSGVRRIDRFQYYGPGDGAQNGYLKLTVEDSDNLALTSRYEYDAFGNVVRFVDRRGNDHRYHWNQLDQIVRHLSPSVTSVAIRYQVNYFYDANDNLVRRDTLNVDEKGVVRSNNFLTTRHEYGLLNERLRTTKEVAPEQNVMVEYAYDANRRRILTRKGEATAGRQSDNVIRDIPDERNRLFRRVIGEGGPDQFTTQYDYDSLGRLIRTTAGLEDTRRVWEYSYDGYGRQVRATDPMGNRIERRYDPNGNVVHERVLGELRDVPGSTRNVRLAETTSAYDEMNRLIRTEVAHFNPESQAAVGDGKNITRFTYSDTSHLLSVTDDHGHVARMRYDSAQRPREFVDAKDNRAVYTYDANANLMAVDEVEKSDSSAPDVTFRTAYEYDSLNRRTASIDNLRHRTDLAYDSLHNIVLVVDQGGNRTRLEHDGLDRVTAVTRFITADGTGVAVPVRSIVTRMEWDDSSRQVAQIDPNGNPTRYRYDGLDRLVTTTYADSTVESSAYNIHGDRIRFTDANGTVVDSTFDLFDRLVSVKVTPGAGVSNDTTFERYDYDGLSRMILAEDDDSRVTRVYDSLWNVSREVLNGETTETVHDALGNALRRVYPGGRTLAMRYDEIERKKSVADGSGTIVEYNYVGPARVESRRLPVPNATSRNSYDGNRRLTLTSHASARGGVIDDRTYAWDPANNKIEQVDNRPGGLRHSYTYDSADRLRRSRDATGAEVNYVLDDAGNRNSVTGNPCGLDYRMDSTSPQPGDRQMNQYTTAPCRETRLYDRNGNLTEMRTADDQRTLSYDYRNQLARHAKSSSGTASTYAYDAMGRRIARTVDGAVTRYVYDGWQIIEEQNAAGATTASYVYGLGVDDVVTARRGSADFYHFTDDLGSVMALTNGTGEVVERYRYDDFGRPSFLNAAGASIARSVVGNPLTFTGQRFDPETGFYAFRTRNLDPATGRFTSRDSIGIWGDGANLGNGTTYVGNNPHSFVDPTGQDRIDSFICPTGQWISYETDCGFSSSNCPLVVGPATDTSVTKCMIGSVVCTAAKAASDAYYEVKHARDNHFNGAGYGWPVSQTTLSMNLWWDNKASTTMVFTWEEAMHINESLGDVYNDDGFQDDDLEIYCSYASQNDSDCANANAYTDWEGDITLCDPGFWQFSTIERRAAVLLHEMTHAYADLPQDKFSYTTDFNWKQGWSVSSWKRINNADTYEMFYLRFAGVQRNCPQTSGILNFCPWFF